MNNDADITVSLAGKTALVTGASSGIGAFMAAELGKAGARLALVGRRKDRLDDVLDGHDGISIALDLTQADAINGVKAACHDAGLQPDIIVNAAGVNHRKSADDISSELWQDTIHLNLSVPFLVSQAFVPHMKTAGWGRIINIASLQSTRAFENGIAYGAAKGGVVQLTRAMAEAWSRHGIMANAIAPGFFPTELTAPVFGNADLASHHARNTAMGRNGELHDLRGPLLFFASDACGYVTGQTLPVDGGYTAK
jgi:NAD(P)-dependent dehydrogenase (short-subunit alcohol dehydrogenase family)